MRNPSEKFLRFFPDVFQIRCDLKDKNMQLCQVGQFLVMVASERIIEKREKGK